MNLRGRNKITPEFNMSSMTDYIDDKTVSKSKLKAKILSTLGKSDPRVIILRAEKNVPIEEVVFVMSIANQNSIKVVLAVDSQ